METFFEKLSELGASGTPFVAVTLVDVAGSTPQDRGSKMLVTREGLAFGTIGGGKAEFAAIERAKTMLSDRQAERTVFLEWNLKDDLNMVCGGAVKLFFEAFNLTPWQIVIFGAGHVSNALTRMLLGLQCQIAVYDTREDWLAKLPQSPRLKKVHSGHLVASVKDVPEGAFVLLMTMGHATDKPILLEILKTREFPYLGVIGSKAKAAELRKFLLESGMGEEALKRFLCPIGLHLGTNHPSEIAVSITAQLIQERDRIAAAKL